MTKDQRRVNKAYAAYRDAIGVLGEAHRILLSTMDRPALKIGVMIRELADIEARAILLADAADEYSHALCAGEKK